MHDAFVSHSSEDKQFSDALVHHLESRSIRCWVAPRDVPPGKSYAEAILDGLKESKVMVLVLTASASGSPHVEREVERALNLGKSVIPVRAEDVMPSGALDYFISSVHWIDAFEAPLEPHFEKLADHIAPMIKQVVPPPAIPEPLEAPPVAVVESPVAVPVRDAVVESPPPKKSAAMAVMAVITLLAVAALVWVVVSSKDEKSEPSAVAALVDKGENESELIEGVFTEEVEASTTTSTPPAEVDEVKLEEPETVTSSVITETTTTETEAPTGGMAVAEPEVPALFTSLKRNSQHLRSNKSSSVYLAKYSDLFGLVSLQYHDNDYVTGALFLPDNGAELRLYALNDIDGQMKVSLWDGDEFVDGGLLRKSINGDSQIIWSAILNSGASFRFERETIRNADSSRSTYRGNVGSSAVTVTLDWKSDGKVSGSYSSQTSGKTYRLAGDNTVEGFLYLDEFGQDGLSARMLLAKSNANGKIAWAGTLFNVDGPRREVYFAR